MTTIAIPPSPGLKSAGWQLDVPGMFNRSKVTGKRRGVLFPQAERYYCSATLPPIIGEANIFAWRAWVAELKGVANAFPLVAVENVQITGVAPTLAANGEYGDSCSSTGWGADGLKLRRGQFVTIADQLLMLMQDVVSAGGAATLRFDRVLWNETSAGGAIVVDKPYALMTSSDRKLGWSVDIGQNYAIKFACEETR